MGGFVDKISLNGVFVGFEISVSVNTHTSAKPTEFTQNYMKTLTETAGKHFSRQMGEAMIERINEDLNSLPIEKLWEKGP
jgi:hypothetical protein